MLTVMGSLFLILVCVDMGIKQYIENTYKENEERETIIDGLVLRKVYNRGFAFNLLEKHPGIVKGSSAAIGAGILLYDIWLFLKKGKWIRKLGMSLLSAGAVSNIYDRLVRGKVVDYIGVQCKSKSLSRLTANLADIYVAVGSVIVTLTNKHL